ncbi:MAG: hypothetical protein FWF25_04180 [Propionibacteriaceae bacterium]|nr:hypothetical protein [Propionibacteriaceae bacterium]
MIFYRGAGVLALIIPMVVYAIFFIVFTLATGGGLSADPRLVLTSAFDDLFNANRLAEKGVVLLISAPICYFVGIRLNRKTVVDSETGQTQVIKSNHGLMFIHLQYWGFILLALGVVVLVYSMVG